jgi:hypothetical protein
VGSSIDEVISFFSIDLILPGSGPGAGSISNRNEDMRMFLRSKARPMLMAVCVHLYGPLFVCCLAGVSN